MCFSPLHPFLAALPKCEHHIHLEGALTPDLLFTLAARNNIALPAETTDPAFASPTTLLARYDDFASLDDFLQFYYIGMSVLLHVEDFEQLAWEYFVRAKKDGVVHAEVFFDPQAHTGRGVEYEVVVEGFTRACRRAENELSMSTGLILCFLRHLPAAEAGKTLSLAENNLKEQVLAGVGLDSSEKDFPPELFKGVFEQAREMGTRRTAHAGEEGGAEFVRAALDTLGVERIDHGVKMVEDPALVAEVARRQLLVTVCPLSNVRLKGVRNVGELPIRAFLEARVRFSINSDDPAYFGGYILDNYCAVQEAFGLEIKDWEWIARAGVEGSWCSEERKEKLLNMVGEVVGRFGGE
ncbi:adenine deaminase [Toensbergia leucococca]|nr:adenine deaminase [Toensbergia leucococca]